MLVNDFEMRRRINLEVANLLDSILTRKWNPCFELLCRRIRDRDIRVIGKNQKLRKGAACALTQSISKKAIPATVAPAYFAHVIAITPGCEC